MFCPTCGSPVPDNARYCPNCRLYISEDRQWIQDAQSPSSQTSHYNEFAAQQNIPSQNERPQTEQQDMPSNSLGEGLNSSMSTATNKGGGMRWSRLYTRFVCAGLGVLDILCALLIFATVFLRFQFLVNILGSIIRLVGPAILLYIPLNILLGILSIVLRGKLVRRERSALPMLYAVCGIGFILTIAPAFSMWGTLGLIAVIPSLVFTILNVLYFYKRRNLYIN